MPIGQEVHALPCGAVRAQLDDPAHRLLGCLMPGPSNAPLSSRFVISAWSRARVPTSSLGHLAPSQSRHQSPLLAVRRYAPHGSGTASSPAASRREPRPVGAAMANRATGSESGAMRVGECSRPVATGSNSPFGDSGEWCPIRAAWVFAHYRTGRLAQGPCRVCLRRGRGHDIRSLRVRPNAPRARPPLPCICRQQPLTSPGRWCWRDVVQRIPKLQAAVGTFR